MRWVLGPSHPFKKPEPPPAKADVAITTELNEATGELTAHVPAHDLTTHNHLLEVRAYVVSGGIAPPGTADEYVASPHPFVPADVSAHQAAGGSPVLKLPDVPPGDHFVQTLLGFDA